MLLIAPWQHIGNPRRLTANTRIRPRPSTCGKHSILWSLSLHGFGIGKHPASRMVVRFNALATGQPKMEPCLFLLARLSPNLSRKFGPSAMGRSPDRDDRSIHRHGARPALHDGDRPEPLPQRFRAASGRIELAGGPAESNASQGARAQHIASVTRPKRVGCRGVFSVAVHMADFDVALAATEATDAWTLTPHDLRETGAIETVALLGTECRRTVT